MTDTTTVPEPQESTTEPPIHKLHPTPESQIRALRADLSISKHVALASGAGFIPVPVFDIVATTGVQVDLLYDLFKIYGQDISKEKAREIVLVLLGGTLPTLVARTFASGLKLIPGIGTALGFFASPSLAGTSTYVIGKVVQEHLATGSGILDLDLTAAKAKVSADLEKIKNETEEIVSEGRERVGAAVSALRGKKAAVPAAEDAGATS